MSNCCNSKEILLKLIAKDPIARKLVEKECKKAFSLSDKIIKGGNGTTN